MAQSFQHFKKLKIRNKLFNDFFKKMCSPPKSEDGCVSEVGSDTRTGDACKNVQSEKNACENVPCEKSMLRDRKPTPGIEL